MARAVFTERAAVLAASRSPRTPLHAFPTALQSSLQLMLGLSGLEPSKLRIRAPLNPRELCPAGHQDCADGRRGALGRQ